MTFELAPAEQAARDRAARFAREAVAPHAGEIDRSGQVSDALAAEGAALLPPVDDLVSLVGVIEELAAASAGVALAVAADRSAPRVTLAGLRGARAADGSVRGQLTLAAVALGIGRAALAHALAALGSAGKHPGTAEKPHWAVADAATELDGARLLTYRAATTDSGERRDAATAMARLMATRAAASAVDVALRVADEPGFVPGALLERLARDVRAVGRLAGNQEQQRATAADGLFPG